MYRNPNWADRSIGDRVWRKCMMRPTCVCWKSCSTRSEKVHDLRARSAWRAFDDEVHKHLINRNFSHKDCLLTTVLKKTMEKKTGQRIQSLEESVSCWKSSVILESNFAMRMVEFT